MSSPTYKCGDCNQEIPIPEPTECPRCGGTSVKATATVNVNAKTNLQGTYEVTKDYVEKNKIASRIVTVISLSGFIIGLIEPPFFVMGVLLSFGFLIATSIYQHDINTRIIKEKKGRF